MTALHFLMEFPEEVEADLAHYYQVDVTDLWRGGLTWRRFSNLVVRIPAGSALWQATGGPRAWTDEYSGLMTAVHRLAILAWMQTEDGSKNRKAPEALEPPAFYMDAERSADTADTRAMKFAARQQQIDAMRRSTRAAADNN